MSWETDSKMESWLQECYWGMILWRGKRSIQAQGKLCSGYSLKVIPNQEIHMRASFCHTNQSFDSGFTREVAAVALGIWATSHIIQLMWCLNLDTNRIEWVSFPKIQILRPYPQRVHFTNTWIEPKNFVSFKTPQMIQYLSCSAIVGL